MTSIPKQRPFLKWAGGKYKLVEKIQSLLPKRRCLVEPFVGAGSVFLNTEYEHYILADVNADLIGLFQIVQQDALSVIRETEKLFIPQNNTPERFYMLRDRFNQSNDQYERAILFIYLNKHCYNGLCRYSKTGVFNVPFGRYKAPVFAKEAILNFSEKAKRAEFRLQPFRETFSTLDSDCVVYCDPPYAPLSQTALFTQYHIKSFDKAEQIRLAKLAEHAARTKKIPVLISNHDTPFTQKIYAQAEIHQLNVFRSISGSIGRHTAPEIMALFSPDQNKSN